MVESVGMIMRQAAVILGPLPCAICRDVVYWGHYASDVGPKIVRDLDGNPHACLAGPVAPIDMICPQCGGDLAFEFHELTLPHRGALQAGDKGV